MIDIPLPERVSIKNSNKRSIMRSPSRKESVSDIEDCDDIIKEFFNLETDYGKNCGSEGCIYYKNNKDIGIKVTKQLKNNVIENIFKLINKLKDKENYKNNLEDFIILPKNISKSNKCIMNNNIKSYYSFNYYKNAVQLNHIIKHLNNTTKLYMEDKENIDPKQLAKYNKLVNNLKEQIEFILKYLNTVYKMHHNDIHQGNLIVVDTKTPVILRENDGSERILDTNYKIFLIDMEHLTEEDYPNPAGNGSTPCNEFVMDRNNCVEYLVSP